MLNKLLKVIFILGLFTSYSFSDSTNNKKKDNETSSEINKEEVQKEYKKPPYDYRLDNYKYGKVWYNTSDIDYESSYNLGVLYHKKIKDLKLAEFWYLKSWSKKKDNEIAFNIAGLYELLKNYNNAEVFYKASHHLGDKNALYNNGVMFEKIKEYKKAKYWYKKAIKRASIKSITNLAWISKDLKENIKACAYLINLVVYEDKIKQNSKKNRVIEFIKTKWKINDETIKKGYELQLTMDELPKKYTGGL